MQKGLRIGFAILCKKGIAGRNAIHFGIRIAYLECNPFKKGFWLCLLLNRYGESADRKATTGFRSLQTWDCVASSTPHQLLSRRQDAVFWVCWSRNCRRKVYPNQCILSRNEVRVLNSYDWKKLIIWRWMHGKTYYLTMNAWSDQDFCWGNCHFVRFSKLWHNLLSTR